MSGMSGAVWRISMAATLATIVMLASGNGNLTHQVETSRVSTPSAHKSFIMIHVRHPRLLLYRDGHLVKSFPVALGTKANATPIGTWVIVNKQRGWGKGFGTRWIGLNVPWGMYGIHGTNRPQSIGRFASHGCIRMRNQDVEQLYDMVGIGTKVIIEGNPLSHLRLLEHGNVGADVREVQRALKTKSFYRGPLDGRFDSEVQTALLYFQLAHQLPMNGEVSTDDYQALGLQSGVR